MSEKVFETLEAKIDKTIERLKEDLLTVRAGRANAAIVDKVMVKYYDVPTPLKQLANISIPDPRTIAIAPFDATIIKDIEHGINEANIGITPSNDGKIIRLTVPVVTEERRKELTKTVKAHGEEAKVAIRNLRRTANDELKKEEKNGDMTEDDLKSALDKVQKDTDKGVKAIDELVAAKDKEIMEV
ncbi:MAG: ribosome recycling factor [Eubacterium sp.]|jgi:ribosome recycling factor|nr:ribosome recycling factor [Eubacterium sp.]